MAKTKKQLKQEQANMQSDNLQMSSDGVQYTGDFTYSFADLDNDFDNLNVNTVSTGFTVDGIAFDNEEGLRTKYPALQDAWNHYKNIKHMCEQKEKEDED
mgnify:FL=1|jgi:hypothetical protein|tara:strand:+ start:87 stop:386 length:300 start_codon:yes stop_codon:yes gene_type:complete